ncbi:hypothetical protein ZIOFF_003442 [Zingiber officinale]|uniref:Glycosyltransferase n=2 Tax=Zingiber officinale TaxID=94328 RepID=A0A8J5HYH2_ZINOF|nr:hypothetical protein ZIOFF_003442 [Zingiber officinale]
MRKLARDGDMPHSWHRRRAAVTRRFSINKKDGHLSFVIELVRANVRSKAVDMDSGLTHFVFVTFPSQGHINPVVHLARRLAGSAGVLSTFALSISSYNRMFTNGDVANDGLVAYAPISDGYDDGIMEESQFNHFMSQLKSVGSRSLSALLDSLAAAGRPATCVVYTIFVPWAADVARRHGIDSALYWIQPATLFSIYYHYFHSYDAVIAANLHDLSYAVNFPGVPPVRIRDLPSFITTIVPDDDFYSIFTVLKELFESLDSETTATMKPKVLMNSFDDLEPDAIASVVEHFRLFTVGPVVPSWSFTGEAEEDKEAAAVRHIRWLDAQEAGSVVYVSFGSYMKLRQRELEELLNGLRESNRPFLWVVRENNRGELDCQMEEEEAGKGKGMVVEWCDQVKVLAHRAVGCFVTHCGWNSVTEGLVCGVPTVGAPRWSDQKTVATLAEVAWGTGVRAEVDEEGAVTTAELRRCLEVVMGGGEAGERMRRKAAEWSGRARDAVGDGGSSDRNLRTFVEAIRKGKLRD